jgi:hypothetical protein
MSKKTDFMQSKKTDPHLLLAALSEQPEPEGRKLELAEFPTTFGITMSPLWPPPR